MSIVSEKADIVEFHGASLFLIKIDNVPYVAIKPICDAIGVSWSGQFERVKTHPILSKGIRVTRIPSQGGDQDAVCLPLDKVNGFLFGINANRIQNPEVREKLISYQAECFDALNAYWNKGVAVNPRQITINTEQQFQIRQAINNYAYRTGQHHQTIYNKLHNKFKIPRYQELPISRFEEAMLFLDVNHQPKNILQVDIDLATLPQDNNAEIRALVEISLLSGRREITLLNRNAQVVDPSNKDQVANLLQTMDCNLYPVALDVVIGYFKGINYLYHGKVCRNFGNN